jgi:hypothetical protein
VEERTAKKQRASNGRGNKIGNESGLIRGAIVINPAYAVTQMCQTVSASTQRRSFEAAAKGFFPDYMVSFRDKPVDVPRGPPPQRRINIYILMPGDSRFNEFKLRNSLDWVIWRSRSLRKAFPREKPEERWNL